MIWTIQKLAIRVFHHVMAFSFPLLKMPEPQRITGPGSVRTLADVVKQKKISRVLVVTDKGLMGLGLLDGLLDALAVREIRATVYDTVQPNPSIHNVEEGRRVYLDNDCQAIIAFGGGSPMDCGKTIGARVRNPKQSVRQMKGLFKIRKALPPIFAVPTTAGTGSETTIASVITDTETHEKFAINSFKNVPAYAVLDPELMLGLPPQITATTGMDALTHAIEAYIGLAGTPFTNEHAEKATRIIFEDLEAVYQDGSDIEKRNNMALASYFAGAAFTRAAVGYVHAIAHNMGGMYGVAHGLANAVILPYVLEYSKADTTRKLARLAVAGGIGREGEPDAVLTERFIEKIRTMNRNMNIPTTIQELREADIPLIARRALKEANPMYPVPTLMNQGQCEAVVRQLLP